jgi:Tfp pilus assembly protein PilN
MHQQINLYQPIFRKQRLMFYAVAMAQGAAHVAAALLAFYGYGVYKVGRLEAEVTRLEGLEQAFTAQLGGIDPSLAASARAGVEQEIAALNATLADRQRLIDVLRDQPLGGSEGFSGYLAALARQHRPELWLTRIAVNGGTRALELAGRSVRAEAVPEYLRRLGSESALAGQRFDRLEIARDEGSGEVQFHATSQAAEADEALDGAVTKVAKAEP